MKTYQAIFTKENHTRTVLVLALDMYDVFKKLANDLKVVNSLMQGAEFKSVSLQEDVHIIP